MTPAALLVALFGNSRVASIALCLAIASAVIGSGFFGMPFLEVQTKAGFYVSQTGRKAGRNGKIKLRMQEWFSSFRPCSWMSSGDFCTVLPFLCNTRRGGQLSYERLWLQASDGERFAADWVFPPSGF